MSRAKLFNLVKSRGEQSLPRNAFDLTNRHVYTSKAGKITPVKALHTYPDDYFEVDMSEFSQNNIPMNTAAFLAGKKEMLAYFVPYNSIWHNFNQFMSTREDPESTLLYEQGISYEPRINLYSLYLAATYFAVGSFICSDFLDFIVLRDIVMTSGHYGLTIENQMTGADILQAAKDKEAPSLTTIQYLKHSLYDTLRNAALTRIRTNSDWKYSHFYHATQSESFIFGIPFYCKEYSTDHNDDLMYYDTLTNVVGNFIWCDWCQKLDMLGYGNIYPVLKEMLNALFLQLDVIISGSLYNSVTGKLMYGHSDLTSDDFDILKNPAIEPFNTIANRYRAKLEGFCVITSDEHEEYHYEFVNVYALYAYNKCFYDYMRNVYYDTNYSVYNYNCDFLNCRDLANSLIHQTMLPLRFYHLESHQWKKDMFTGILPDNQLGQVSELVLNVSSTGWMDNHPEDGIIASGNGQPTYGDDASKVHPLDDETNDDDVFLSGSALVTGVFKEGETLAQLQTPHTHVPRNYYVQDLEGTTRLNVLAFKRAEAIQQYRQDLMRAGNRTKDVFQQVFGKAPKSQMDETPYFIDVASNDININPIISTAQTGEELNGSLGDIAARSTISGNSLHFKFSTHDFGVVIFLSYIVPESFYNSYRLDPCVTHLDQEAHGLPYFQNLGLQPVLGEFLNNMKDSGVRYRTHGFAPPYIERKTDIDLCHGNTCDLALTETNAIDFEYQGSLSHWVVARTDMQGEDTTTLRSFYINPRILDSVFKFNASDDYETDHFLTYSTIKINAVRAFSELGLPRF